jgi:hypothetical protein
MTQPNAPLVARGNIYGPDPDATLIVPGQQIPPEWLNIYPEFMKNLLDNGVITTEGA